MAKFHNQFILYTHLRYYNGKLEERTASYMEEGIFFRPYESFQEKSSLPAFILTDCDSFLIEETLKSSIPVIAWQHEKNQDQALSGTPWLILDLDAITPDYLDEIWARYHHLPLQITSTPRLCIRELTLDDLSDLLHLQSVLAHCPDGLFFPENCESPDAFLQQYIHVQYSFFGFGIYGLFIRDCLIGIAGYSQTQDPDIGNLSYAIHPLYQRQGYASEAILALYPLGKERFGFQKVYAYINKENTPSLQLVQKCGIPYLLI